MKKSIFLIFAAILCASSAWGIGASQCYVYFDNSTWNSTNVKFVFWQDNSNSNFYIKTKLMTTLSNTQLKYVQTDNCSNWNPSIAYFNFLEVSNTSDWGDQSITWSNFTKYATTKYTAKQNDWNFNGGYQLFTGAQTTKNKNVSGSYNGSYGGLLDRKHTLKVMVSTDGGNTYTQAETSPAKVSLSSYKMSSKTSCGTATSAEITLNSSTTSKEVTATYTANTTLRAENIVAGYTFAGWYDATNGKMISTSATPGTWNPKDGITLEARFNKEEAHPITISYKCGSEEIQSSTTTTVGVTTPSPISAPEISLYKFSYWTLGSGVVSTDDITADPINITTKSGESDYTLVANYDALPTVTLYFVNSDKWATAKCHHWKDGGSGTTWPGDPMEVVGTVHGFDIYKVQFTELEHNLCIFNNDDKGKQTGNLAVQDGKYYYPETDEWYATVAELPTPCTDCSNYAIAGSMNDWSARRNRLKVTSNNDIVELTLELTAGDYEFKIAGPKEWFGNSGKYERKDSGNAWTFRIKDDENNDEKNASIYIDMTGEYTFTWQISTKKLTITYPELPDFSQQTNTILFRPSTDWKKADARFAAYFFGATAEKWVNMTDADGDGIYEATNPKTNLSVKICRLDPDKAENKWDNVWNQSTNYEIPTGIENCWVVNDGEWDGATGIWTVLIGEGDNSTTLSAANSQTVNTLVNRQFESEKLYTISLPFAVDAEQVETIFGAGTTLYQFAQLAKEGEELVLYFSTPSAIAAATPYLIQPTQDVTKGFIVEDATISSTPNNISFTVDYTTITMEAILSVEANAKTDGKYWLAGDKYLYNNENDLPALRALFNVSTKSGMPPRARVALGENAATGLDNITNGENTTIKLFENGQLIIIRNGEKFNAQGVKF